MTAGQDKKMEFFDGVIQGDGSNDMRAQVREVRENLRDVLATMGGRMADEISLVHYATDIDAFMTAGDARLSHQAVARMICRKIASAKSIQTI